jgi:hypothetical protein
MERWGVGLVWGCGQPDPTGTARANISIYVVSTRVTDFFLVHVPDADRAVTALRAAGHRVTIGTH